MGLLTLDVTALGVVMSSDSWPIEIVSGAIHPLDFAGERRRDKIIERRGGGFDGLIGYVGTEQVGSQMTRAFIEQVSARESDLALGEFAAHLAGELSAAWAEHELSTGLDVFIAGAEDGELRFWYLRNFDFKDGLYTNVRRSFTAVNDLDENLVPQYMRENALASKAELLSRIAIFLRTGVLSPAASLIDDFQALVRRLYAGEYTGFDRISSLDDYARLVLMRQEFVKRMFSPRKGIYRDGNPPIGGAVYIRSVSPGGDIVDHEKNVA